MSRSEKTREIGCASRIHWLDNLRTFMVFLVVLCHAGGVYESSGVWASFWIVDDLATNDLSGLVFLVLDIFMMPTIFFISGYFVPLSRKHRSAWAFLRSKFKRLIIPWALAVLTLVPLYKVMFLYSRNLPQAHWTSYFHWSNGIWNQNWLWFLPVLFLFDVLYLFGPKSKIRLHKKAVPKYRITPHRSKGAPAHRFEHKTGYDKPKRGKYSKPGRWKYNHRPSKGYSRTRSWSKSGGRGFKGGS